MLKIEKITENALQTQTLVLPNGNAFTFTIYYVPLQYGWFITNLTYQSFTINSLRITNNANMLYQYQNLLPFGLGCFSKSNREPTQQEDFSSGASALYILTEEECAQYRTYINGGVLPA